MPNYNNRRKKTSYNTNNSTSADWQGLLYYSIIGILIYIGFMAIRSLSLGNGQKHSFLDWLKSIFAFGSGNGGTSITGNGSGSGNSNTSGNNTGFESPDISGNGGIDMYSGTIKDYQYFKASEYFGNYPRPTNPVYIANYDKLMKDLDLIRKNFGSAVKIVSGYKASDLAIFQECRGVHIKATNGNNDALNKVVLALRNSGQITGVSVYIPDSGETRYYNK